MYLSRLKLAIAGIPHALDLAALAASAVVSISSNWFTVLLWGPTWKVKYQFP
jgi:hypothetical protein